MTHALQSIAPRLLLPERTRARRGAAAAISIETPSGTASGTSYGYNGAGELTSISSPTISASDAYNGEGLCMTAVTDGQSAEFAWAELTGSPEVISNGSYDFVYGPSSTPIEQASTTSGATTYLGTDRLGSVVFETGSTGSVLDTQPFGPYEPPQNNSRSRPASQPLERRIGRVGRVVPPWGRLVASCTCVGIDHELFAALPVVGTAPTRKYHWHFLAKAELSVQGVSSARSCVPELGLSSCW